MTLKRRKNVWLSLIGSIISQQLSVRVASVIHQRFLDLYQGEPTPADVLTTKLTVLRSVGLSNAKAQYVHNIAQFELDEGMSSGQLETLTDEEVIAYLTRIKGVGKWTVEMLLMFTLGREDIFPLDDLGIQQAMIKIYRLKKEDKKIFREKMINISTKWSPYRTYASLHLWHHKDKK
jgi:DNA-3-methyladenine glycosylase II